MDISPFLRLGSPDKWILALEFWKFLPPSSQLQWLHFQKYLGLPWTISVYNPSSPPKCSFSGPTCRGIWFDLQWVNTKQNVNAETDTVVVGCWSHWRQGCQESSVQASKHTRGYVYSYFWLFPGVKFYSYYGYWYLLIFMNYCDNSKLDYWYISYWYLLIFTDILISLILYWYWYFQHSREHLRKSRDNMWCRNMLNWS